MVSTLEIGNRRYYGNKTKLLPFLDKVISKEVPKWTTFVDIFSGTGSVANYFNQDDKQIIANDILFHNFCALNTWISATKIRSNSMEKIITRLNNLKGKKGYVFKNFSNTFITEQNAMKIDSIREKIEQLKNSKIINKDEYYFLLTSLFYAVDKCSNIITQYEAYLKEFNPNLYDSQGRQVTYHGALKEIELRMPKLSNKNNSLNKVYQTDANKLIKKLNDIDILYLDPPYTCRQYCNNYHFLENIVEWKKPKVFGKAKKADFTNKKSKYSSRSNAREVFEDLIGNTNAKTIIMSYNNHGILKPNEILEVLNGYGKTKLYSKDYNGAHVCTSKINGNKELLFVSKLLA
ncbi:MAG TPA: DNA adenine methylase [Candidatus Cloacimonas acidaminovorans]|nr:DNA adenine methylase [Candidatus Cloacimonas acidaminovorans]